MNTKQVVAIIGASGKMGSALARTVSKGNYCIRLYSSKTVTLHFLVNEIKSVYPYADIEIINDYVEIGWQADVVILAIPYKAEKEVARKIASVVNQKVIISISNPINSDYNKLSKKKISAAEELQKHLPNAKVIKAFNTVTVDNFNPFVIYDPKPDCFIAGNDNEALELVYDLVRTVGFHPVLAGDLSMSKTLENIQHQHSWQQQQLLSNNRMENFT
jgi:8-hydroxy-5-deazaflavin:NADPH oxidoreductase